MMMGTESTISKQHSEGGEGVTYVTIEHLMRRFGHRLHVLSIHLNTGSSK